MAASKVKGSEVDFDMKGETASNFNEKAFEKIFNSDLKVSLSKKINIR